MQPLRGRMDITMEFEKIEKIEEYKPLMGNYIRLDANESPFDSVVEPFQLENVLSEVLLNRYPDPTAFELCDAYAEMLGFDTNNVVAGNGSDELISIIINGLFSKCQKLTICPPDFSMYRFYAQMSELDVDIFEKDSLELDLDKLEAHMNRSGSKAVIFSNPCNPTGQFIPSEKVIDFIKRTGFFVIVDEAYMDFCNDSIVEKAADIDNVIVLKTLSKLYGLAALRVGFAVCNQRIATAIRKAKSPYNVNSLSMAIATHLVRNCTNQIEERKQFLIKTREEIYDRLKELFEAVGGKVYKTATNFNLIEYNKAEEVYETLLKQRIAVRRLGNLLRITVGTSEENEVLLQALRKILD